MGERLDPVIRGRAPSDRPGLETLARAVRSVDGYPPRSTEGLASDEDLAAWVAVDGDGLVGHIALRPASADAVMEAASAATSCAIARLTAVSRLLVAPRARRRGTGGRLLDAAVDEAHRRSRWPVLDVAQSFAAAIALYEARGWNRVGAATFDFCDGPDVRQARSWVYIGPAPPGRLLN